MLIISLQICRFCQEQLFGVLPAINSSVLSPNYLKFVEVPFIKYIQILNMYYPNPNYYDFWTREMPLETSK